MGWRNTLQNIFRPKRDRVVPFPETLPPIVVESVTKSVSSMPHNLRAALAGAYSGSVISNHREEALHFENVSYIAVHGICMQLHASTTTAYLDGEDQGRRTAVRKSLRAEHGSRWKSVYGADESASDTLDVDHELMQLLRKPNPHEPGGMFRYRQVLQIRLTGGVYIWNVPSKLSTKLGRQITCQRYVIPTNCLTPVFPNANLPYGGYRIQPNCARWIPQEDQGYIEGTPALMQVLGWVIDARFVQKVGFPHPIWLDDFCSPMSAGAQWVDGERAINTARTTGISRGIDPSILVTLPAEYGDIDQDTLNRTQKNYENRYGGPDNTGKPLVTAPGTEVTVLGQSPKDMAYHDGFEDHKNVVLALHGTPPVAAGFQESGAYAAYFASRQQYKDLTIDPLCDMLAESDTFHLAPQFGDGITIEIESKAINDKSETRADCNVLIQARSVTKNTLNKILGYEPLEGPEGDKLVGQDQPQAGQPGQGGAPGETKPGESDHAAPTPFPKPPRLPEADDDESDDDSGDDEPKPPKPPVNPFAKSGNGQPKTKALKAAIKAARDGDFEWLQSKLGSVLKARDPSKPYKFSSTQINLPAAIANRVIEMGKLIPDDELADDGREGQPHCTVLYGLISAF